jgi:hypothetical protein
MIELAEQQREARLWLVITYRSTYYYRAPDGWQNTPLRPLRNSAVLSRSWAPLDRNTAEAREGRRGMREFLRGKLTIENKQMVKT